MQPSVGQSMNCTDHRPGSCYHDSGEYSGYVYVMPTICIIGSIVNLINLVVFRSKGFRTKSSTVKLLVSLAVSDLICLILASSMGPSRCLAVLGDWEYAARRVYEVVFLPLVNTFATASVWLTTAICIERYVYCKHTFAARTVFSEDRTRICIGAIYSAAIIINLPSFFYQVLDVTVRAPGSDLTEFGSSYDYKVYQWIRLALVKLIPVALIILFNAAMIVFVGQAAYRRHTTVAAFPNAVQIRRQRMHQRVTVMLICMSLLFVACHVPEPFSHPVVYASVRGPCSVMEAGYRVRRCVTNCLEMFSFAVNFFFYLVFHQQFALVVKQFFGCGRSSVTPMPVSMPSKMAFSIQL